MRPDRLGRRGVIARQVLGALAGSDDLEAAGARPVDHLADQGRLVAVSHGIDHAGLPAALGQERPRQHVGLDVDHDDVLAVLGGGQGVGDARGRVAGGVDHDVDLSVKPRAGNQRQAVLQELRALDQLCRPADGAAGALGALRREVGDGGDLDAPHLGRLGQEHGAELAGADQPDADRAPAIAQALLQKSVEIHGSLILP